MSDRASSSAGRVDGAELEAGRELDALVAERVMGWVLTLSPRSIAEADDEEWWSMPSGLVRHVDYWRPSTDIAAAWEVVEKLRDLGFFLDISVAVDRFDVDMRADRMPSDWWLREGPLAEATTAPLAICRAALQAITLSTNSDGDTLGSGK
jgi:hypothetical protein